MDAILQKRVVARLQAMTPGTTLPIDTTYPNIDEIIGYMESYIYEHQKSSIGLPDISYEFTDDYQKIACVSLMFPPHRAKFFREGILHFNNRNNS